jgi:hypothetical protein
MKNRTEVSVRFFYSDFPTDLLMDQPDIHLILFMA